MCRSGLILPSAFCLGLLCSEAATAAPDLEEWFRSEYTAAAPALKHAASNLRCRYTAEFEGTRAAANKNFSGVFCVRGDSRQLIAEHQNPDSVGWSLGEVDTATPNRAFTLTRHVQDGPYAISNLADQSSEALEGCNIRLMFRVDRWIGAAFRLYDVTIDGLLHENPGKAEVTSVTRVESDGRRLVEVVFAFPDPDFGYETACVLLDPSLGWAIRRQELTWKTRPGVQEVETTTVEYARWGDNDAIFPKQVFVSGETVNESGEKIAWSKRMVFQDVTFGEVADSQFRLSAFGLPDIAMRPPSAIALLEFQPAEVDVRADSARQEIHLTLRLHNRSLQAFRVVGAKQGCDPNGCVEVPELPRQVGPHGEEELSVTYTAGPTGSYTKDVIFYTDCPAQPVVTLKLRVTAGDSSPQ